MLDDRVLVTGATGLIGRHLLHALLSAGEHVRVPTRENRTWRASVGERVELVRGDLAQAESLTSPAQTFRRSGRL